MRVARGEPVWLEVTVARDDRPRAPAAMVEHGTAIDGLADLADRALRRIEVGPTGARPAMRGTDLTIRRLLLVPATEAPARTLAALADPRAASLAAGGGRLDLAVDHARRRGAGELCVPGRVRLRRHGHGRPVELVVAPWTADRTELRLEAVGVHRALDLPRRYWDVTQPLLTRLRDLIESARGVASTR